MKLKTSKKLNFNEVAFRFLFFLLLTSSSNFLKAQKFQVGLSAGFNSTFAKKGESEYDATKVKPVPIPGFALAVPVYLKLNDCWYLRSGFGYQLKHYRMQQTRFDIPGINGKIYFGAGFNVFEIPLLLSFMPKNDADFKVEYTTGMVISSYTPSTTTIGTEISGTGMGTQSISAIFSPPSSLSTYSPDVYFGINFVKYKENLRRHQISIAYQIGLKPSPEFSYSIQAKTDTQLSNEDILLKPRLNTLTLTYTFFPKKFCF